MTEVLRFVGLCLLTVLFLQLLKGINPAGSVLLLLGAVVVLGIWGIQGIQSVLNGLEQLVARTGLRAEWYAPVIKVIGIASAVQIAGAVCKDAGASALAFQLEIAGVCASLIVCMPLFEEVLVVADALLE